MTNLFKKINRRHFYLFSFIIILAISAFVRFYKIDQYLTFLGDEGRDVLVVKRMIIDHKFTLLGPITSVGSMYMGPIYYYFMVPFLWIWQLNPVGPAMMVAIFGVLTVALIYITGAIFFHPSAGLVSALLYALAPLPIVYGRASWNPNIVPFFSLLVVFSLLNIVVKKKYFWLLATGMSMGILIQLHYVTFMFFPVIFTILLLIKFKIPIKYYLFSLLLFILAYSPFMAFELRHGFVNTQSVIRFIFSQKRAEETLFIFSFFNTLSDVFVRLFWRLLIIVGAEFTKIFLLIQFILLWKFSQEVKKHKDRFLTLKIILIWIGVGLLSYGIYRGVIYDYYFGSLFTAPFLLFGILFYLLWTRNHIGKIISVIFLSFILGVYLLNSPLKNTPNNMLKNTEEIARFVFDKTENKPYNFALIAGQNSDHAYRYFLEIWGNPPQTIENQVLDPKRMSVTDTLFVICEEKVCKPLGHPLWEIAGFGRAEIVGEWVVSTARVFKLIHFK